MASRAGRAPGPGEAAYEEFNRALPLEAFGGIAP